MTFVDEIYESRWFVCGWAPRQEGVLKVASRLKAMAAGLDTIERGLGQLWPQFEPRRLRPSDPGPLPALSEEDLARLIDRRGRADPPAIPAPVGPGGYHLALAGEGVDVHYGANIWVESSGYALEEPVRLTFGVDSPVWRSAGKAARILFALVDAWSADWAVATAFVDFGAPEDGEAITELRPWMAWAASGSQIPKDWVSDAGAPLDILDEHGGQMSIWPWPPSYGEATS